MNFVDGLLIAQGAYFLATGVWPLLHIRSFLAVTGPKTDLWLVKTVGILIAVVGAALLLAGIGRELGVSIFLLAGGSALALAAVDVIYAARGTIAKVYLLDAALEAALLAAWAAAVISAL